MTAQHARSPGEANTSPSRHWVTAVLPAYNSEDCIATTIRSLRYNQTRPPDRIVVVANNCTDRTAQIAKQEGALVINMPNNPHKKAGALNYALERLLPGMDERHLLLIQDDDTISDEDFIRQAMIRLTRNRNRADAVGPVFYGREGGGLLGLLQRNEYIRFASTAAVRKGNVIVLSGTAAMFRADSLQEVSKAMRNGKFDGEGYLYNIRSQTEDHYLTLVLHQMGFRTVAPPECHVVTDVMTTVKALWHQRIRWQHGTVDDLRSFGWCSITREAILRQAATALLIVFTLIYPFFLVAQIRQFGVSSVSPARNPIWAAIGLFVISERVISVRAGGWRSMLIAAALIPEWMYDTFRQIIFISALFKSIKGGVTRWVHT